MQIGGVLWVLIGLGVIALGVAMVYGTSMWRDARKNPTTRAASDAATRELYRDDG